MAPVRRRPQADNQQKEHSAIAEEAIRNRAHQLYQQRGSEPGRDLEDWLQAERELKSQREPTE
jgi:hypothetical protein